MHVCMIDENSHYSQPAKASESNLFSLRKRAPIESLRQVQDCSRNLTARTSPSTFLFLLSSQCQRTDHSSVAAVNRHRKHQGFPYLVSNRRTRWLPSRSSCPVPKTANSGSETNHSTSSTWPGCKAVQPDCQHPFSYSISIKLENLKHLIA